MQTFQYYRNAYLDQRPERITSHPRHKELFEAHLAELTGQAPRNRYEGFVLRGTALDFAKRSFMEDLLRAKIEARARLRQLTHQIQKERNHDEKGRLLRRHERWRAWINTIQTWRGKLKESSSE